MVLGRSEERDRLCAAIDDLRLVVVCGGVGIGKSALVRNIDAGQGRVLIGQALPSASRSSFHPILHALGWSPSSLEPSAMTARVKGALDPTDRLVLEDLHWADNGTLEVLSGLAGYCPVVVTVGETTSVGRQLVRLAETLDAEVIELGPLSEAVTEELVATLRPDLLPGERVRLARTAAGNPLVASLLASSADLPELPRGGQRALLRAIVGHQSARARTLLALLALAPGPVDSEALGCTETADVEDLCGAGLVSVSTDGSVSLTHRVFADLVIADLDPAQRRELADWAVAIPGIEPYQRAGYLLEAGRPHEALELALRCMEAPGGRTEQAAVLLVAARASGQLESIQPEANQPEANQEELVVRAAEALNDTGRHRESTEILGELCRYSPALRARAVVEALRAALGSADHERACAIAESSASLLVGDDGVDAVRAQLIIDVLREARGADGRPHGAEHGGPAIERLVREHLAIANGSTVRSHAALVVGLASLADNVDDMTEWLRVAKAEAQRTGELTSELEAARNLAMMQISLGGHEEARTVARDCMQRAIAGGEPSFEIEFRTLDRLSRFYDGADHDDVLAWFSFVRTAPVRHETRALATSSLATLLADRGEVERSAAVLEAWITPEAIDGVEPIAQAVLLWGATQSAWILGDTAEAIRFATWATELLPPGFPTLAGTHVVWRWAQYEAGVELTAPDPAGGLLDSAQLEADAIASLAAGDPCAAAAGFQAAAESWRPVLRRCALRSQWGAGVALTCAGENERAVQVLESVASELEDAGCRALGPRIGAALRAAGARRGSTVRRGASREDITAAEHAVMSLVAEGLRTPDIARRLCVAPATVQSHVASVMTKLGVHSRAAASVQLGASGLDRPAH
ncbi:MAG: LuxR C-terminal-related transcriptional regulator [Microthrixaceae bacterium]